MRGAKKPRPKSPGSKSKPRGGKKGTGRPQKRVTEGEKRAAGKQPKEKDPADPRPAREGEKTRRGGKPSGEGEKTRRGGKPPGEGEKTRRGSRPPGEGEKVRRGSRPPGEGEKVRRGSRPAGKGAPEKRVVAERPKRAATGRAGLRPERPARGRDGGAPRGRRTRDEAQPSWSGRGPAQASVGRSEEGSEDWVVGRNPVRELLEAAAQPDSSSRGVDRLLLSEDLPKGVARVFRGLGQDAGVIYQSVPRPALDRLAPDARHQGVAIRVTQARLEDLHDMLDAAPSPGLFLLLDGVEDPRNLGAMVRSAAAAGASGVIVPERRSASLTTGAAKAAAGALERIPIARAGSVQRAMNELASRNVTTVGLDASGPSLWEIDLKGPTCFIVGGEGKGLARLTRERCDTLASFPLAAGVESLNASVAASLALYEARRQRQKG